MGKEPHVSEEPSREQKFHSMYDMMFMDFERLHRTMCEIDFFGKLLESGDMSVMRQYLAAMKNFYMNIRHLAITQTEMDAKFTETESDLMRYEDPRAPAMIKPALLRQVIKDLDFLTIAVYELKQSTGLGLRIQKRLSEKKKWNRAMRL